MDDIFSDPEPAGHEDPAETIKIYQDAKSA